MSTDSVTEIVDVSPPYMGVVDEPPTIRWHRHRWSPWDRPYLSGGLSAAFGGGLPRQQRSCKRCDMIQDRSCVVADGAS